MEKGLFLIMVIAILAVLGIIFYLFFAYALKGVTLTSPNGGAEFVLGNDYLIKWNSSGVDKVGIVLFNGNKPEWIAQNIDAKLGSYKWTLSPTHEHGSNFWLAVFDYPWRKGSSISYSSGPITIAFSKVPNCDALSVQNDWPYLLANAEGLRKAFVTPEYFTGNLSGLDGADQKCQASAQKLGYAGDWVAFIGGDKDEETAVNRLKSQEGFFVDANPAAEISGGATCHKLLGNNLADFLSKFTGDVWLGRVNPESKKNCVSIGSASPYDSLTKKYSYTDTCQNWTQEKNLVSGYSEGTKLDNSFPSCYTPTGQFTYSLALAGIGVNSVAEYCSSSRHLLCVQK